jgi:hypothetical protein
MTVVSNADSVQAEYEMSAVGHDAAMMHAAPKEKDLPLVL